MAALLWRQQIARQTENRFKYFVHLFIKRQAQDAAYCYQYFVVCVCLCVCVSVNHNRAPYKNGWTDWGAVWDMARRITYYVGTRILPGNGTVVWRGASPGPLWSTGGSSDAAFRCQKRSCLPLVQYTLWVKKQTLYSCPLLRQMLTYFQNSFTVRLLFVIKPYLKISVHLKHVAHYLVKCLCS